MTINNSVVYHGTLSFNASPVSPTVFVVNEPVGGDCIISAPQREHGLGNLGSQLLLSA